jgi:DNA polymerase elongation subunit (family B)
MSKVVYQCFDCILKDQELDDTSENLDKSLTIHTFGKKEDGTSVAVNINGFMPSIYIEYSSELMNEFEYDNIQEILKKYLIKWVKTDDSFEIEYDGSENIIADGIVDKKSIWGYNFEQTKKLFKFSFTTLYAYKKIKYLLHSCQKNKLEDKEIQLFINGHDEIQDYKEKYAYIQTYCRQLYEKKNGKIKNFHDLDDDQKRDLREPEQSLKFMIKLSKGNQNLRLSRCKLYDVIDPVLRFAHQKDLKMASWFAAENCDLVDPDDCKTSCDQEYDVDYNNVYDHVTDVTMCGFLKEMAFDIETYSPDDKFPDPKLKTDVVYQIGISLKLYKEKQAKRVLLHLAKTGKCLEMPEKFVCIRGNENVPDLCKNKLCKKDGHVLSRVDQVVENFDTEVELLLRFKDIVVDESPDLLYGYNSDGYDWNYIYIRSKVLGIYNDFCQISRLKDYNCKVVEKKFASSAYGVNYYYRVDIPGRLNIDLMIWIQRNMPVDRYPDYKLDTIAEIEINQKKHGITFKEIFAAYRTGNSELLTKVGDYCLQDTILVQQLINKLDVVTQLFEMSNLASVPVSYLLSKGQQIKVFSIISKDAMNKGFVVPLLDLKDQDSFTGAIVLEPKVGTFHTPIAVLDFASLYPSIQVAHKICYSTLVLDKNIHQQLSDLKNKQEKLLINDTIFDFIEWKDDVIKCTTGEHKGRIFTNADAAKEVTGITKKDIILYIKSGSGIFKECIQDYLFFFAQNKTSIIPDLQVTLKTSRKNVKKMMGKIENSDNPEDQLRYRVLNGRQLAIKVTMNSIYGFTSAFMLNLSSLSACVTARGRQMIEMTKEFMEEKFESIAKVEKWSIDEENTWYNDVMREIITEMPDKDWIRKYPTAKAGETWIPKDHSLSINVVGGDTDSVFCNFPNSSMEETISLNHKAEVILTREIFNRHPIEMEYEKTYCPMVIVKKKNYIGIKYEMNPNKWKVDFKGIAIKRRNYCKFTKDVYWSVIYPTLGIEPDPNKLGAFRKVDWDMKLGPDKALQVLRSHLLLLVEMNFKNYDDFIISAALKDLSSYKQLNLPQVQLAIRMAERDESSAPKSGQRFGFVIVNEDSRGDEVYQKSEDPVYAIENGLQLDYLFYLNNQIRNPLTSFLELSGQYSRIDAIFNEIQDLIFEKLKKKRALLEKEARLAFFDPEFRKRTLQVTPLKAPKKQALAVKKQQKKNGSSNGNKTIDSFFTF